MINATLQKQTLRRCVPRLMAAIVLAVSLAFAVPAMLLHYVPIL
jgi:hypothetical protein